MSSPTTKRAGWTLALAGAGLFMTALDNLVVGVALPSIRADLGGSIESLEWTVNAYTLAFAVLLLTGAALVVVSEAGSGVRAAPEGTSAAGRDRFHRAACG